MPIDSSLLPADVRAGSQKDRDLYSAALGLEQLFLQQLTGKLAEATDSGDDDPDGATEMYRQMLPQALAESVTAAGGVGLARSLYDSLKGRAA
jgi:Rod binding domain-containing protein